MTDRDTNDLITILIDAVVPKWLFKNEKKTKAEHDDATRRSVDYYNQRLETQEFTQSAPAPRFDYIRWKQQDQHRMHQNPDEYIRTCQCLAPYISTVATSAWEGMDEMRWKGMTTAPPPAALTPHSNVGSVSRFGSKDNILSSA